MKDFFVSYHHVDEAWAEWIAWVLEEAAYSVVVQAWDFRPGENFVLKMQEAAKGCRCTIAVLSDAYLEARFTQVEWAAAFARDPEGRERRLLPVRVGPCQPAGLLDTVIHVDLVGVEEAEARTKLLEALRPRGKPERAPVFPGRAEIRATAPAPTAAARPRPAFPEEPEGLGQLVELLGGLFNANELRRFVALLPEAALLGRALPGDSVSPETLVFEAVHLLRRRGLIKTALFDALRNARPERAEGIEAVQASFEQSVTRGDVVGRDKIVVGDEVRGDKHVHHTYQVDSATDVGWLRHWYLRWGLGVGAGVLLLTVLLNGDVSRALCTVPGVRPICGALGAGGVADDEEREAWCAALAALPSPDGLNDYLRRYRDGVYASEAESRLAHDCTTKGRVHWLPATMEHPLVVSQGDAVFASREAAERDARERGAEKARALLCVNYTEETSSGVYRLGEVTAEPLAWKCTDQDGWKCGFDGRAICDVEKRQTETFVECAGSNAHRDCES